MANLGSAVGAAAGKTGVGSLIAGLGGPAGLLGIGASLIGSLIGAGQKRKARKMLAGLKDPGYQIPEEYKTNLAQAEQLSRQGLPAEQYNLATTNIQRGTQAGLRQLGRMSNPFAGISGLARTQSDALAGLDASNAAARRQNILGAMGARTQLAQQKLAQQQYAQQRYMDQVNQANALLGAGAQNVAGGLSGLANIGTMLGIYGPGFGGGGKNSQIGSSLNLPKLDYSGGLNQWELPGSNSYNTPQLGGNNLSRLGSSINKIIPRKR